MTLWKMSIKTGAHKNRNAFQWCKDRGIVGIGWSVAYQGSPESAADPLTFLLANGYREAVSPVKMLVGMMRPGDFVWLHQGGGYFLCKVLDAAPLIGPDIGPGFLDHDIGHARKADWVAVTEDLVPGVVQRAVIARRMIQQIKAGKYIGDYCALLHSSLERDPAWRPAVAPAKARTALESLSPQVIRDVFSPDDWEDVLAAYLQLRGWILVKSSCFRSKPRYEFRMMREEQGRTRTAYLQAKSGRNKPLLPMDYAADVTPDSVVFLFSTHATDPYPGGHIAGVVPISYEEIHTWMLQHTPLIPLPVLVQLSQFAP